MNVFKKIEKLSVLTGMLAILGMHTACNTSEAKKKDHGLGEIHQASVHKPGSGMIYVDKINCDAVMEKADARDGTSFHCYLVGVIDSLSMTGAPGKKKLEAGKYYQYDMQRDWTAIQNGDSLRPVFYHPKQRLESHRHEAVLVFETTDGKEPGVLVYNDSYSLWGTQQLILTSNKK